MFELTGNNRQVQNNRAPAPKLREDGTNYPYRMFFDGNARIVDADTLTELVGQLIPGYLDMSEDEQHGARRAYAHGVAFQVKVMILAGLTEEAYKSLSEWEYNVLHSDEPLKDIYPLARNDGEEEPPMWKAEVPLVLIESDYYPFSAWMPPMSAFGDSKYVSNIITVRAETDEDLLDTLSYLGVITYGAPQTEPTDSLR